MGEAPDEAADGAKAEGPPARPPPFIVVLTGGPSSGKSSALALLRSRLSDRGFQVLTAPENATHFLANSDGFQPEWAGTFSQVCMQRIFLEFQLAQEDAFKAFAELHPTKRAVILLDCCTLNSKIYLSDEQWEQVLNFPGKRPYTEAELWARYDLVVHLVTSAIGGHYEFGPGSNNPGRYSTPEQAREQEARCLELFGGHPQLRVVPHCPAFGEKVEKVVEFVNDALQVEGLAGKRRRRPCRVVQVDPLEALAQRPTTSASMVTSVFLDRALQHSVRLRARIPTEAWLEHFRRRGDPSPAPLASVEKGCLAKATDLLYERRSQVVADDKSGQGHLTRRVIGEEEYSAAVHSAGASAPKATRLVIRFVEGSRYYELFFFLGHEDLVLDLSAEAPEPPPWLELIGPEIAGHGPLPTEAAAPQDAANAAQQPAAKRRRKLRAVSTLEAASITF